MMELQLLQGKSFLSFLLLRSISLRFIDRIEIVLKIKIRRQKYLNSLLCRVAFYIRNSATPHSLAPHIRMLALAATASGDFRDVLTIQQVETPDKIGSNELLVKVAWTDVNPVDLQKLQRASSLPFITGFSGSGIVEQTSDAAQFPTGSRVCFLVHQRGSYAQYCVVDRRAAAVVPENICLREAACVPLAGCTAFESLQKLGLLDEKKKTIQSLLIIGGSGGVGSWATRIARAVHPDLQIICTTSSEASSDWCKMNGASRCIPHEAMEKELTGDIDAILCLTEPTPTVMKAMSEVIRPYGSICLVVAGSSIRSLDLSFIFFKSVTVCTETMFNCFRTNFVPNEPAISQLLSWVSKGKMVVPLSPLLDHLDEDWTKATKLNGILDKLQSGHMQGKLVMRIGGTNV